MKIRVRMVVAFLILLTGCAPARTPPATPTARSEATETPRASPTPTASPQPSATPWPTRRPTRVFRPATRPAWTPTPGPTCPPQPDTWTEVDPLVFVPMGELKEEGRFQNYVVRIYDEYDWEGKSACVLGGSLEVLKGGQRIYAARALLAFSLGRYWEEATGEGRDMPVGQDITGDGVPNLVIVNYTGGMQCCVDFHVFQLGEEFLRIGTIVAPVDRYQVVDLDTDGNVEFIVWDRVCGGCGPWAWQMGPEPRVIQNFRDGAYRLALDLMREPAPASRELLVQAQRIGDSERWPPEVTFTYWETVLNLVYTGHAELVDPFLEMVWPDDPARRESAVGGILRVLSTSLYWPEIKELSAEWPWPEDEGEP